MSRNECGKMRDKENPYEIWRNDDAGFEWRVLKKYQKPELEAKIHMQDGFVRLKVHILGVPMNLVTSMSLRLKRWVIK